MLKNRAIFFIFLVGGTFMFSLIPVISYPLTWMQTFFHEISHGLVAMATGGRIVSIRLELIGSGVCISQGGGRFAVAYAGYFGAAIWGGIIYSVASTVRKKYAEYIVYMMAIGMTLSAVFYARDIMTWVIFAVMVITLVALTKLKHVSVVHIALRCIGIYILLNAIKAPLWLIDGRHFGDGATLANLTHIPEVIWVFQWMIVGCGVLYFLWRQESKIATDV